MLAKENFKNLMERFNGQFDKGLGDERERLLYSVVSYMTETEFQNTLIETITRFNRDELPTIKQITTIAFQICPEAINQKNPTLTILSSK